MFAVPAAPLIELPTRCGEDAGKCCSLSGAHQLVLRKIGFAGPPDDPFHWQPIKRNVPATTDDTSDNESFHAPLPKGHETVTNPLKNCVTLIILDDLSIVYEQIVSLTDIKLVIWHVCLPIHCRQLKCGDTLLISPFH